MDQGGGLHFIIISIQIPSVACGTGTKAAKDYVASPQQNLPEAGLEAQPSPTEHLQGCPLQSFLISLS